MFYKDDIMPYLLHIYSNCYADKKICKEKYIKKQSISGEIFQKNANTRLFAEPRWSWCISTIHNWMEQKLLNLKLFMHLLNKGGLYKIDQTK